MTEKEYPCGTLGIHGGRYTQGLISLSAQDVRLVYTIGDPQKYYSAAAAKFFGRETWDWDWCLVGPEEWL